MRGGSRTLVSCALLFAVAAPISCQRSGTHGSPRQELPSAIGGGPRVVDPRSREPIEINVGMDHEFADGCRYRATVLGTMTTRREDVPTASGSPWSYSPRLTVSAEVDCGNGVLHHLEPTSLDGQFDAAVLERDLRDAARVNADANGRICTYQPVFRIQGDMVIAESVAESCRRAPPTP